MNNIISDLKENQIFVFGSNLQGKHIGGAAKQAYEMFGAKMGYAEGIYGQSYAFPTLGYDFEQVPTRALEGSRERLYYTCEMYLQYHVAQRRLCN